MSRKIRMGMVGGGPGAFIGAVHRMAAALDGQIELVCGAFSSSPEVSKAFGSTLLLPPERSYGTYLQMMEAEQLRPDGDRMDVVSIVTPNHLHFGPAKAALEAGFHVVCDKPLAFTLEEALELQQLVEKTGLLFALTHNYTGYPMVKQARQLIQEGKIGNIRKVLVEYLQGWLASKLEDGDNRQASWRTDPQRSGISGCMGDIGTHAENLAEYITGLQMKRLLAQLHIFVEGRQLDDDGTVLMEFDNGAKGLLMASQVAIGEENGLRIRIYGDKGSLEWGQEEPNTLLLKWPDRPREIIRTGWGALSTSSTAATRLPAGHPEGYLEGFANIYKNVAACIQARLAGTTPAPEHLDFPSVKDGVRGMLFIQKIVDSSQRGEWVDF